MDMTISRRPLPIAAAPAAEALVPAPLLQPGDNCWRIETASRAAVIVDAGPYFGRLAEALARATGSIVIAGWDFDGRIALTRAADGTGGETLGDMLRRLVEEKPDLHVRILVWSVAVVHAPSDAAALLVGAEWQDHPRIELRLDTHHPAYGSHHQKIVVIDDALAFCGGIDLTVDRWDTSEHRASDPRRMTPDGRPYHAVHDMMLAVEGPAARALGDLCRERWRTATGEAAPEAVPEGGVSPWPPELAPEFHDAPVAIARTIPPHGGLRGVYESGRLTLDVAGAARRLLYVEAQYLASFAFAEIVERQLSRPEGPEVVILVTRQLNGFLETVSMGKNRDRLIRRMKRADRFDRLRVFQPVTEGTAEGEHEVFLHAKLLIADDRLMRIGSSNLNNRSAGVDTECDLAIEAQSPETARAIAALRERLLAEHLGTTPERVHAEVEARGSTVAAIDALNTGRRGLRLFAALDDPDGPTGRAFGTGLLDPKRPFRILRFLRRRKPRR